MLTLQKLHVLHLKQAIITLQNQLNKLNQLNN